eukprot:Em0022g458a
MPANNFSPFEAEKIIYVKGCTELEEKSAIALFQVLEKKEKFASYLESVSSILDVIGRKDLALAVSTFNLKQSAANERAGVVKRAQSEKNCRRAKLHTQDPRLSLPIRIDQSTDSQVEQRFDPIHVESVHEYSRDESTSTDDHMYRSDQLATRPSPGNLSLIESDGTGEKLDSLASNGHGAASEPDIETLRIHRIKTRINDPCFSSDFKWKIKRTQINDAIYDHRKSSNIQCPNPLRVPIYGYRDHIKIIFTIYCNGLDRDKDVNTTLEAQLRLPDSITGSSACGISLDLTVGAFDSGGELLKLLTAKTSLNVQIVDLYNFVSHQELKRSQSEHIHIRAGCKTDTPYRLEEGSDSDNEFVMVEPKISHNP